MDAEELKLLSQIAAARGMTVEDLIRESTASQPTQAPVEPQNLEFAALPENPPSADDPVVTFSAAPSHVAEVATDAAGVAPLPPMAEPAELAELAGEAAAAPSADEPATVAGSSLLQPKCQHCGWKLSDPVVEEPSLSEITAFLHCCLGQKLYSADYKLMGGGLSLRIRALRVRELEAIYDSAHRLQLLGVIQGQGGHYEYVNRMRVYLQLVRVATRINDKEDIVQLPEVLDAASCGVMCDDWKGKLQAEGRYSDKLPLLDQVRDYMVTTVLSTEHLQRILSVTCARFNRKIAMLESRMADVNFWSGPELPT